MIPKINGECDRNCAEELGHPLCLPVAEQPPLHNVNGCTGTTPQ